MLARLTTHACARANQRGVPHALIEEVLQHADRETPIGGGRIAICISRKRLAELDLRTSLGSDADRLSRLMLVCDALDGAVVTVLRQRGSRGRRYHRA